eukprot:14467918-Ditylum_brightwellii.AAC.1
MWSNSNTYARHISHPAIDATEPDTVDIPEEQTPQEECVNDDIAEEDTDDDVEGVVVTAAITTVEHSGGGDNMPSFTAHHDEIAE